MPPDEDCQFAAEPPSLISRFGEASLTALVSGKAGAGVGVPIRVLSQPNHSHTLPRVSTDLVPALLASQADSFVLAIARDLIRV
jgi:hypothetical protein